MMNKSDMDNQFGIYFQTYRQSAAFSPDKHVRSI